LLAPLQGSRAAKGARTRTVASCFVTLVRAKVMDDSVLPAVEVGNGGNMPTGEG
jgi:hypothetical protein